MAPPSALSVHYVTYQGETMKIGPVQIGGKRRPVRRPRARNTIDERERAMELRIQREAIATLRSADPERYKGIMIDRALDSLGVSRRKSREDTGGNLGLLSELMNSEFASGLAQGLVASVLGGQRPALPQTTVREVTAKPVVAPEQPAALPTPEPLAQPATQPTAPISRDSQFLIARVRGKSPDEIADMFLKIKLPIVEEITEHLGKATDQQLPALWASVKQASPNIGGFVDWFVAQEVYMPTVYAIRSRLASQIANGAATLH